MLIERLLKVALLGSSWVLYLLLALSVLSFSTMVERWWYFRKRKDDLEVLRAQLKKRLEADDLDGAARLLDRSPSLEARVAREALRWISGGPEAIADVVESELARVKKEVERGLSLLGTLGNNAPFIGLFGTVLGVIIAFHQLGDAGRNTSAMGGVMAGIAEALVATGVGLFVAIPAVVGYNVVQRRIGDIETDAVALTKLLTAFLKAKPALRIRAEESVAVEASAETSADPDDEGRLASLA
jgi:biopolymer transport protein ExbB/biopolymer transport protein TolQ